MTHDGGMTTPETALRGALRDLLGLVLPVTCGLCGRRDRSLCAGCAEQLGASLVPGPVRGLSAAGLPVYAAGRYRGRLRRLILLAKDGGRRDLLNPLAGVLAAGLRAAVSNATPNDWSWDEAVGGRVCLVAVPSRPGSERVRGYRHVELIARRAAGEFLPTPPDLSLLRALSTDRGRVDQVGLSRAARLRNGALTVPRSGRAWALAGRRVWLIDDVATTGASLAGAHRALRQSGASVECAVVCAAVNRSEERVN